MSETRIHDLRMESGKSQELTSDEIGMSQATFSRWEIGTGGANSIKIIKKLTDYYQVSSDYLLGFTSIREPLTDVDKQLAYRLNRLNNQKLTNYLLGILDEFEEALRDDRQRVSK